MRMRERHRERNDLTWRPASLLFWSFSPHPSKPVLFQFFQPFFLLLDLFLFCFHPLTSMGLLFIHKGLKTNQQWYLITRKQKGKGERLFRVVSVPGRPLYLPGVWRKKDPWCTPVQWNGRYSNFPTKLKKIWVNFHGGNLIWRKYSLSYSNFAGIFIAVI